jgi:hypothetical protein
VIVEPSGRFENVPPIGVAAMLLITVKTMPGGSAAVPLSTIENVPPLIVTTVRRDLISSGPGCYLVPHL